MLSTIGFVAEFVFALLVKLEILLILSADTSKVNTEKKTRGSHILACTNNMVEKHAMKLIPIMLGDFKS